MIAKEIRSTLKEASFALAESRRMCCREDLVLIESALHLMHAHAHNDGMTVVQLGAGSGTMGLMIMSSIHTLQLVTIDNDQQALNWELQVLENCGWTGNASENGSPGMPYYHQIYADSTDPGLAVECGGYKHDLIIIDADHSYEGAKDDLEFWQPLVAPRATFFLHDYSSAVIHEPDTDLVPEEYPGVKQAADEFFGRNADMERGWSGIFFNDVTPK